MFGNYGRKKFGLSGTNCPKNIFELKNLEYLGFFKLKGLLDSIVPKIMLKKNLSDDFFNKFDFDFKLQVSTYF